MAHFAELDENNMVINVIVLDNNDCLDENGNESETVGIAFCKKLFGENTRWIQTSFNNNIRKKFAGVGDKYYPEYDAFVLPCSFPSWAYNPDTNKYEPPIPYPENPYAYEWNETTQTWDLK